MTTITDLQHQNGARPYGACTGCGEPLMRWAGTIDGPRPDGVALAASDEGDVVDIAQGSRFCGPLGRGDYRPHTSNITMSLARQAVFMFGALAGVEVHTGLCTCCTEPRLAFRYGDEREEWGHIDDQHYAEMKHLHVDSSSSDCDGRYNHDNVVRLNSGIAPWALRPSRAMKGYEDEKPTWHDLVTYMFTSVSVWSGHTTIEMSTDEGWMRWSTITEEGGEGGQVRVCADPGCAYDDDHSRDHTAERANY